MTVTAMLHRQRRQNNLYRDDLPVKIIKTRDHFPDRHHDFRGGSNLCCFFSLLPSLTSIAVKKLRRMACREVVLLLQRSTYVSVIKSAGLLMHAETARINAQHEAAEPAIIGTCKTDRASPIRNSRMRSPIDPASFSYDEVSPEVAEFLRVRAGRICNHAVSCVVNVGSDLAAAKHYLSHGKFVRWVESEAGMQPRTAQIYMQAARWLRGKNATVAHLPVSAIYLLSARSTPVEFAADALRRLEAGEQISVSSIKAELRNLKCRHDDRSRGGSASRSDGVAGDRLQTTRGVSYDYDAPISRHLATSLVGILAAGLSELDFEYVRRVMTDDAVVDDLHLAKKLAALLSESATVKKSSAEASTPSFV